MNDTFHTSPGWCSHDQWVRARRTHSVAETQKSALALMLLADVERAHVQVRRRYAQQWAAASASAALGVVAVAAPAVCAPLALAGVAAAVAVSALLAPCTSAAARAAADVQDTFDRVVLGLDWPARQAPSGDLHTVADDAAQPWYSPEVDGLPWPFNAMQCQLASLRWDARLRRRWAALLGVAVAGWLTVGAFAVGAAGQGLLFYVAAWLCPGLAALAAASSEAAACVVVARSKQQMHTDLSARIRQGTSAQVTDAVRLEHARYACDAQVQLGALRGQATRVPNWLYAVLRNAYEKDMRAAASDACS